MKEDVILYQEFLDGNMKAFDTLMDKYMEKLIFFIHSFVKNLDTAEDLAQDVFVYILVNKQKFNSKYSLKTYLFLIGKCRALNYIKKEKRIIPLEENRVDTDIINIEELVLIDEEKERLLKSIDSLKPPLNRAVFLADIENLPYKDICKILDMSMPKVKSLIFRGRKKLKELVVKEEKFYDR